LTHLREYRRQVTPDEVVDLLVGERPSFHLGGAVWNALPETLELIARHVGPGDRTIETGAGASTIVFASVRSRHTAISPIADEHERIRAWCLAHDIPDDTITFVVGTSDRVLPTLADESYDAAFIDGKHSFPHPVVDWHYLTAALKVGGVLLVDDLPIPAVAPVVRHMSVDPGWELLEVADNRAGAFRKLAEPEAGDDWAAQAYNRGYPDFSFLPPAERLPLQVRHAVRQGRREMGERVPALRKAWRRVAGASGR
jgi:predicted O-methyltransferase YrrM